MLTPTGVNMSDHSSIFHRLEKHLHSSDIPTTVILESRKCSNVTNMLQVVLYEILEKFKEVSIGSRVMNLKSTLKYLLNATKNNKFTEIQGGSKVLEKF